MAKKIKAKDHTKFKLSKPFGYYPPDVDEAIEKYELALSKLLKRDKEHRAQLKRANEDLMHTRDELRSLHLQLSAMELPDVSEAVTYQVLDEFKLSNRTQDEMDADWGSVRPKPEPSTGKLTFVEMDDSDDSDDGFTIAE